MLIKLNHSSNELVYKLYDELSGLSFIPKLVKVDGDIDTIEVNEGTKATSLSKEKLISVSKALSDLRRRGYAHNNLTLNNLLFKGDSLVAILGFEDLSLDKPINDFLYLIDNYIDLEEEYYSSDYALDLILDMTEVYDRYTDNTDLGYELYWYFINKMNSYPKESDEYNRYDRKLRFVITYKPYLDELHQEEI